MYKRLESSHPVWGRSVTVFSFERAVGFFLTPVVGGACRNVFPRIFPVSLYTYEILVVFHHPGSIVQAYALADEG